LIPARPFVVPEQILLAVMAHAEHSRPDECCGLIAMDADGAVRFAYPLTNADPSPVRFTIDPLEHFASMRHAETQGWEIRGVFHSHPTGEAVPSATDVAMALDPDWFHLIVGVEEIGVFRIEGGEVKRVGLIGRGQP
jgi:proteasome lid subunit RPN8/RPN11